MGECELIAFISTIACILSKCCSTEELTLLAAIFTQLGDSLATILTKRELSDQSSNVKTITDSEVSSEHKDYKE
ncbi:MAG TPA: hypothetical protein GXZ28_07160 [Clostridiales bacterium]|nr:hypothetical protein [Clostridiales bacterium]